MRHEWILWLPVMGYLLARFTMPPSTLRLVADVAMKTFVVVRLWYLWYTRKS